MTPTFPSACTPQELEAYRAPGADGRLCHMADALLRHQRQHWPRLGEALARFETQTRSRSARLAGFTLRMQHNPDRFANVTARVDATAVAQRPCFLCAAHLPAEQRGILVRERFAILCNPAPLFGRHLTIAHLEHVPQRLAGYHDDLLELAAALGPEYALLYNGPWAGASAPDHMHFQAGAYADLPLSSWLGPTTSPAAPEIGVGPGPWGFLVLRGADRTRLAALLAATVALLDAEEDRPGEEPRLNLVARWADDRWTVALFPRRAHRPQCFFASDEKERILISPGVADMAGLVVVPRPHDWLRVDARALEDVFAEVAIDRAAAGRLAERLAEAAVRLTEGEEP